MRSEEGGKSLIVPCRARGLGGDHNSATAYMSLRISEVCNDRLYHGVELVCTYSERLKQGVKFRFCIFCR